MTWLADNAGLTGLLFFFVVFVGIAIWLYMPGTKKRIESFANIPFEHEDARHEQ